MIKKSPSSKKIIKKNLSAKKKSPKTTAVKKNNPQKNLANALKVNLKNKPNVKLSKKQIIIISVLLVAVVGIYYFKSLIIAATVNGEPITRLSLVKQLETMQGQQVLESMIMEKLIFQEANRLNITVEQSEIDTNLQQIEESLKAQNQDLESVLKLQGMSKDDLIKQLKIQSLVEKILTQTVEVTEDEINQYLTDNQDFLPEGKSEEELKTLATEQLKQQKMSEKYQAWIQELKDKAQINYFIKYNQ